MWRLRLIKTQNSTTPAETTLLVLGWLLWPPVRDENGLGPGAEWGGYCRIPNRMFAGVFLICWNAPTSEMFPSNREAGERCSFGVLWLFSCYFRSLVK